MKTSRKNTKKQIDLGSRLSFQGWMGTFEVYKVFALEKYTLRSLEGITMLRGKDFYSFCNKAKRYYGVDIKD